LVAMLFDQA
jgi:hypothetical protein